MRRRASLGDGLMVAGLILAEMGTCEAAGFWAALALAGVILLAVGWKLG